MKKLLSITLILCTVLSLCAVFSSCGAKSPWEKFAKSGTREYDIEKTEGTSSAETPTDYYSLKGEFKVNSDGRFHINTIKEIDRHRKNNNTNTEAYETVINLMMRYDYRDNLLTVWVVDYAYNTVDITDGPNDKYFEWFDGFKFVPEKTNDDAKLPLTKLEFDMSKYFDDKKLSADEANAEIKLDASYITSNKKGFSTETYTTRNTDWEKTAIADIMDMINATVADVDAFIEKNQK